MKIMYGTLGVFWTHPGYGICFHADVGLLPSETAREARARFCRMFPGDVVVGVKDSTGRWVA